MINPKKGQKVPDLLQTGELINGRYLVMGLIGKGNYGQVFSGVDQIVMGRRVAIKVMGSKHSGWVDMSASLFLENNILKELNGGKSESYDPESGGFPTVFYFGPHNNYLLKVVVMELLGPSLDSLFVTCGSKFSIGTVLILADQLISRLEHLHGKGYLHRDLKPDNIVMGRCGKKDVTYLIDFGLSKDYWKNRDTKEHISEDEGGGSVVGTQSYMSCGAHTGNPQSRRDDMESLVYIFALFLRGTLPWKKMKAANSKQKSEKILEMKLATKPEDLFGGQPEVFVEFYKLVKGLKFDEKPDYEKYRRMFREQGKLYSVSYNRPWDYDWQIEEIESDTFL